MLGGGEHRGVLDMASEDIFRLISQTSDRDFLIRVSFVEIYNENIRDLLATNGNDSVQIREDPRKGVYCEASEVIITDFDSIIDTLRHGSKRRTVESTAMNDTSSRSHTIFKIIVESKAREGDGAVLVASLNLIDLAGSESVRHTGASGQRAKEGGKINQSLLSLSRVMQALSQPGAHVSFRDSKLTYLLKPSLSGNAKMSIICCITPSDRYIEETRSTLQFASRAKLVTTHAEVNEVVDESIQIKRLKKEVVALQSQNDRLSLELNCLRDNSVVNENIVQLQNEIETLKNTITDFDAEKDIHLHKIAELESQVSVFEENNNLLNEKVHELEGEYGAAEELITEYESNLSSLRESVVLKDQEFLSFQSQFEQLNSQLQSKDSEIELTKNRVLELEAEVSTAEELISGMDADHQSLSSELEAKNEFIEELANNEVELKKKIQELEMNLLEMATMLEQNASLVNSKDSELVLLQQEHQAFIDSSKLETDVLTQELGVSKEELVRLQTEADLKDQEIVDLQEQVETLTTSLTQNDEEYKAMHVMWEQEKQLLESRLTELESGAITSSNEQIAELKSELAASEEIVKRQEFDLQVLQEDVQNSHSREQALALAVTEADEEVKQLKDQILNLEKQLEESVEEVFTNSQAVEKLDQDNADAQLLICQLQDEVKQHSAQYQSIVEENNKLQQQLDIFEKNLESLQHHKAASLEESEKLIEVMNLKSILENQLASVSEELLLVKGEYQQLSSDFKSVSDNSSFKVEEVEVSLACLQVELGKREGEVSELMTSVSEWKDRAVRAEHQLNVQVSRENNNENEDIQLRKKLQQVQTNLDLVTTERDTLSRKLSESVSEFKTLSTEARKQEEHLMERLESLTSQLEKSKVIVSEHQSMVESMKIMESSLSSLRSEKKEFELQVQSLVESLRVAEDDNYNMRVQLESSDSKTLQSELRDVETRLQQSEQRETLMNTNLKESQVRLSKSKEEIDLLKSELHRLEDLCNVLTTDKDMLQRRIDDYVVEVAEQKVFIEESKDSVELMNELNRMMGEKLEIETLLSKSHEEFEFVQSKVLDLGFENEKLTLQLTDLQYESDERVASLEKVLDSKTLEIQQLHTDLMGLRNDSSTNERIQELETELQTAEEMISGLESEIQTLTNVLEGSSAREESLVQALQESDVALQQVKEELNVKVLRVQHLEKTKLTQDQLEKIKVIKEERKKFADENKVLKKQIASLEVSYHELKASGSKASTTSLDVSDLKLKYTHMENQFEHAQSIIVQLKDKLRDCSKQLQEYEDERNAVIQVLDSYGIDTTSLISTENSLSLDNSNLFDHDISSAVTKLAHKLNEHHLKKLQDVEDNLSRVQLRLDESRTSKAILEKKLETLKGMQKSSREDISTSSEVVLLKNQVDELTHELEKAKKEFNNVDLASTQINSEVQALEEENIEIMQENKSLRLEVSKLRTLNDRLNLQLTKYGVQHESKPNMSVVVDENVVPVGVQLSARKVDRKRSFGQNILNVVNEESVSVDGNVKGRRVRAKASKAEVDVNGETSGECVQS